MGMKKPTSDRHLKLNLMQRVCVSSLLVRQTGKTISSAIGRAATDEDTAALYSVMRKVRCEPEELLPYQRRLGMETVLDLERVSRHPGEQGFMIDGYEARVLREFLAGWLKNEGSLGDRDWLYPLISQLL